MYAWPARSMSYRLRLRQTNCSLIEEILASALPVVERCRIQQQHLGEKTRLLGVLIGEIVAGAWKSARVIKRSDDSSVSCIQTSNPRTCIKLSTHVVPTPNNHVNIATQRICGKDVGF